jgi:hypothetical protein
VHIGDTCDNFVSVDDGSRFDAQQGTINGAKSQQFKCQLSTGYEKWRQKLTIQMSPFNRLREMVPKVDNPNVNFQQVTRNGAKS